jgi:CBS domain-containing protein
VTSNTVATVTRRSRATHGTGGGKTESLLRWPTDAKDPARDDGEHDKGGLMRVNDLMTRNVVTVTPDTSLRDAAALLVEHKISGVPVVTEGGEVAGVVSEADILVKAGGTTSRNRLLGWLLDPDLGLEEKIKAETVGEAMSAPAILVSPTRPVFEAARLMVAESVNRLPVVEDGRLVGILTRADIVRAFTRTDAELAEEIRNDILRRTFWLEPGRVTATVVDGHVILTGEVETEADAEVLPALVARVPGVLSVESDLTSRVVLAG